MLASTTSRRLLLAVQQQQQVAATTRLLGTAAWSNSFSFVSPEADFSGGIAAAPLSSSLSGHNNKERLFYSSQSTTVAPPEVVAAGWSNTISFASPESDFTRSNNHDSQSDYAVEKEPQQPQGSFYTMPAHQHENWSNTISFASPESDFTRSNHDSLSDDSSMETPRAGQEQQQGSFYTMASHQHNYNWSNTMSFTSPESDFTSPETTAQHQRGVGHHNNRYPETLAEALRSQLACVVTRPTAPHTIVAVNPAWTDLCGYTADEVVGQSLGMIQGSLTNTALAAATVQTAVDEKEWVDMYLVNYKKNGSPFTNHVSLKEVPLNEDEPTVRFLIGVLEPVDRAPLRMIF